MVICSRCHKRAAVVFVTKVDNGEKKTEGICMTCARELGMPVDNIMNRHYRENGYLAGGI